VFQLLHANTPASIWDNEFIVATDLTYRPHAEISPVAEKCYTILFGQYLLMDLMGVALTVYDVVEQVRETQDEQGFGEIVSSPAFLGMFNRSFHRRQFPYVLAALIEGERYRFSQTFSHLSGARHKAESFYIICVCFIVAHELAHFKNGDFGTGPSKYRNYYEEFFTKGSDLCVLDSEDEAAATAYLKNYAPRHCREIGADFEALRLTVNISIEVAKTRSVGIAAVSLVLGVLGWMDRASHYLVTGHDPAHVVGGRNYNRKTGYIDIRMPMENHPWGKTRCMTAAVHLLCLTAELDDGSQIELEHKIGTGILGLFAETIPEAMAIVGFVSNARGEFLAYYSSNADLSKIQTAYWPDILSSDGKTVFETAVDDLYGMREIMFVANGAEPDYGKAVKALAGLYGLKPPQSTD
jgi:hypothetical protein